MKLLPRIYKVRDKKFVYSPEELERYYEKFKNYSDQEFIDNIVDVLHFATYVCWLKEIPGDVCLADDGIIHELVHLIKPETRSDTELDRIRDDFNEKLIINR